MLSGTTEVSRASLASCRDLRSAGKPVATTRAVFMGMNRTWWFQERLMRKCEDVVERFETICLSARDSA